MTAPKFDIFSGTPNANPLWMDAVEGIDAAQSKMYELANERPGPYFVYAVWRNEIVAIVDTSCGEAEVHA
jgi:hypothetical protein